MLGRSIPELLAAQRSGRLTARELTHEAIAAATSARSTVNAFLEIETDAALAAADAADAAAAQGRPAGPLHGIPYALKDVIDVAGRRTTAQSAATDPGPADDSAPVHLQLQRAGAIYLGKLATHEFALGGPSHDLPHPPALNPWDPARVPGASSSGAGAAVALRAVTIAIGTDTSGSVRNPAAHCGVYGLKPTFGVVPRQGVFPLSFSLDHLGPLVASARDLRPVLGVLAQHHRGDPASSRSSALAARTMPAERLRIGYAPGLFDDDPSLAPSVAAAVQGLTQNLEALGHEVRPVVLPSFAQFNAVGRILMGAEGFAIHEARLVDRPMDYGRYTYQRLMAGSAIPAGDHVAATQVRRDLIRQVDAVLDDVDVIVTANALSPAARFSDFGADWPPVASASATRTIPFNVTGHPALAVPVGLDPDGMPLSAQLVGRHLEDAVLCDLAVQLEDAGACGLPAPPRRVNPAG